MAIYVILWVLCASACVWLTVRPRHVGVGLPASYALATSFLYGGFTAYLHPDYRHDRSGGNAYLISYAFDMDTVLVGVQASLLGMGGFLVGIALTQRFALRGEKFGLQTKVHISEQYLRKIVAGLCVFGLIGFGLTGLGAQTPLVAAVLQVARNAAIVAVCLGAAMSVLGGQPRPYGKWAVVAALIPLAYLIGFGFLSFGFIAFTIFLSFWLAVLRRDHVRPARTVVGGTALTYLLLSGFLTWMGSRAELRSVLWSDAGLGERIEATWTALRNVQFLDFSNLNHLDLLNARINQYIFVGKAIEHHEFRPALLLHGESIYMAIFAWIPRFLWPNKPEMGGTEFLSQHTGMEFSEKATFGTGPVLEFYVNFGWMGVFFGFVALGILLTKIDITAGRALYSGDLMRFALWFAVGIAFIAPLTSIFFMINTAAITLIVMWIAMKFAKRPSRLKEHLSWRDRAASLAQRRQ